MKKTIFNRYVGPQQTVIEEKTLFHLQRDSYSLGWVVGIIEKGGSIEDVSAFLKERQTSPHYFSYDIVGG